MRRHICKNPWAQPLTLISTLTYLHYKTMNQMSNAKLYYQLEIYGDEVIYRKILY